MTSSHFGRITLYGLLSILILVAVSLEAEARTVIRSGESVVINADQTVEGDFYGVANTLSAIGNVTEDVLLAGGRVTLGGSVTHDALIVGGTVAVNAAVGDDVRIVGGDVTVTGPISGDLVVLGGTLTILSSATIGGDVVFYGGRLEMNGQVMGDVIGTVDRIRLDGMVGGGVDVTTTELTLGDRAQVTNTLRYTSATPLVRGQGAMIEGDVLRNDPVSMTEAVSWRNILVPLLVLLFSLLTWQLLSPRTLNRVALDTAVLPLRSALIGFGVFFFTPVLIGVMVVSLLGSIVGLVVFLLYIASLLLALVAAGAVVGQLLARLSGQSVSPLMWAVAGTILLYGLVYIPVVGPAVMLGLVVWTLGTIVERVFKQLR